MNDKDLEDGAIDWLAVGFDPVYNRDLEVDKWHKENPYPWPEGVNPPERAPYVYGVVYHNEPGTVYLVNYKELLQNPELKAEAKRVIYEPPTQLWDFWEVD